MLKIILINKYENLSSVASDLNFGLILNLLPYYVCMSSERSIKTASLRFC